MAEVALEHVEKVYANGVRAVCDLSLTAADGELLVLVGPSGSGKTTVLRLIAGLEAPTAGILRIGGLVVNGVPPRRRDVALVFQKHGLYPHLSVYENLAFGMRLRERRSWLARLLQRCFRAAKARQEQRRLHERVLEAARLLALEDVLERRPGQLSGGQQQRAALGRALVRQPAVFLLDEPLSNLDWRLRADLRRELHLLQRRLQATMIYVTHDQLEALTLGDRVVVLDRGAVQQADTPAELYRRPRNRFVAGFIGWPPMNFLDGRLVCDGGRVCFQAAGGCLPLPRATGREPAGDPWAALAGKEVTLGIRPEAITLGRHEANDARLTFEVALVESLGGDCLVTLRRKDWRVTAKAAGAVPASGEMVEVTFDMRQSYWFDRASGLALGG
jgi:multiple sugar transport system ATP-binding protein